MGDNKCFCPASLISGIYHFILRKVQKFFSLADNNREKVSAGKVLFGFKVAPELVAGFITFWVMALAIVIVIIIVGLFMPKPN